MVLELSTEWSWCGDDDVGLVVAAETEPAFRERVGGNGYPAVVDSN